MVNGVLRAGARGRRGTKQRTPAREECVPRRTRMIEWFARNGVAANLLIAFIIVSGILAATNTNEEIFPEMELDRINVEIPYLGAAPEEVEDAVNVRIEEAIQGHRRHQADPVDGLRGDGGR